MRNRHLTSMVSLLLVCTTLVSGCATDQQVNKSGTKNVEIVAMEPEESHALSFDFIGGKDVMPIAGYYGPYAGDWSRDGNALPEFISDEIFEKLSESGLNMIVYSLTDYKNAPAQVNKMLELGSKYNIGMYVKDSNVIGPKGEDTVSVEEAAAYISKYSHYPAFCGMYLQDEPNTSYYVPGDGSKDVDLFTELGDLFRNQLDINFYANAYPMIENYDTEPYRRYLDEFFETFQPRVLTTTNYAFAAMAGQGNKRETNYENYFRGLSIMREYAQKYEVPFWSYINAGSQFNDDQNVFDSETPYLPDEALFRWSASAALAYGAQGFNIFLVVQPYFFGYAKSQTFDSYRNGLIGVLGTKNAWYYYLQNLSEHIGAIDEVLMNSVNKGVIVSGEKAKKDNVQSECIIESGTFQELQSVNGDAMVGCFNYNGKTALYVMNYSIDYAQHITLEFDKAHNIDIVQQAEKSYVNAQSLTLDIEAGDGVLLVVQ